MDKRQLTHQHLILPFASSLDEGCQAAIKALDLPHLSKFLKRAEPVESDNGDEFDFIPPHERIWLKSVRTSLPSVRAEPVEVPANTHFDKLSANGVLVANGGVVITPCHWLVGIDRISMAHPADLQLTEAESQALFALMRPYFLDDGIELMYSAPLRWYAVGDSLSGIAFASLDRVIGRNVDAWQPAVAHSKAIRRLQNEMQMLLYVHPINETRTERGLPTVNSFWLSHEVVPTDNSNHSLKNPALASDWQSWVSAWTQLDQTLHSTWMNGTSITLCGERNARTYAIPAARSLVSRATRLFKSTPSIQSVLASL